MNTKNNIKRLTPIIDKVDRADRTYRRDRAYSIVGIVSIISIILTILSLSYVIDNASRFNSLQLFTFLIISLYIISQAGSLFIFSKFKNIKMMKSMFFKATAITIIIIGLLTVYQTIGSMLELGLIGIFTLLVGTIIPLAIGSMVWKQAKTTRETYVIQRVSGYEKKQLDNRAEFIKAQKYKEEFDC